MNKLLNISDMRAPERCPAEAAHAREVPLELLVLSTEKSSEPVLIRELDEDVDVGAERVEDHGGEGGGVGVRGASGEVEVGRSADQIAEENHSKETPLSWKLRVTGVGRAEKSPG